MEGNLKEPLVSDDRQYPQNHEIETKESDQSSFTPPLVHPSTETSTTSPYAVPMYESNRHAFGFQNLNVTENQKINIIISSLYVISASMTIIQGFGIVVHGSFDSIFLGLYTMCFGLLAIAYDLRCIIGGIQIETYFPFLGNYFGRSLTVFYFGLLSHKTYYTSWWNSFIYAFDLLVALVYGIMYTLSNTVKQETNNPMKSYTHI